MGGKNKESKKIVSSIAMATDHHAHKVICANSPMGSNTMTMDENKSVFEGDLSNLNVANSILMDDIVDEMHRNHQIIQIPGSIDDTPSDKISFDDDIMGGMATMGGGDDIVGIETAGNDHDNNDNHNGDFIIEDDEDNVVTPMYVDEDDIIEDIGVTLGNDVDFDNDEDDVVTAEGTDEDIIVGVETAGNDNLMVDTDSDDENEIIDDVNTVQ